jgi:hypothetical protein
VTISDRDRRALLYLGLAVVGVMLYVMISDTATPGTTISPQASIETAERRLQRMRQLVAQVPGREEVYKQMMAQLAAREKRLLVADTAAQAQAQLLQVVRRLARSQNPPVEIKASEFGIVKSFGSDYGEVPVSVTMECGIEQLLNIIAEVTSQPELMAVSEVRIYSANPKQKTNNVRLSVSAIVPKKLLPEKKGATS